MSERMKPASPARRRRPKLEDFPAPGSAWLVPLADGRRTAARVLQRANEDGTPGVLVLGSAWIGPAQARPAAAEVRPALVLTHHSHDGHAFVFWTGELPPSDWLPLDPVPPSAEEATLVCRSYTHWDLVARQALLQWRWDHEREALLADLAREEAEERAALEAARKRRAEWLATLTLDGLREEKWFAAWDGNASDRRHLPPARAILRRLVDELRVASRPQLERKVARRLLKTAVASFNELQRKDHFIDTFTRAHVCEALEQVMCAARFPDLAGAVHGWRTW